ncbi:hypothetical protein SmJEL517_g02318 [Synchytrium microbalum]|uniref:Uncharacterized protein n=1 Tax=Synchytrium microbalum TaxID=1806994 RepID=A0A507C2G6_9FUNG|nr:uncharacterized protein SmJEL517_g02318 [Synchytrium microbalum]TPX35317.1 hypothetical protein SmJEL517_g02318 [Synchytrium microbalum]
MSMSAASASQQQGQQASANAQQLRADWFTAIERQQGTLLCTKLVADILQKSQDVIFQKHIDRQVLPYAIQYARESMLKSIQWEFFKMDPGETDLSTWDPDPEPQPVRIDSWARGALPVIEMPEKNIVPAPPLTGESMAFFNLIKAIAHCRGRSKTDLRSTKVSRANLADKQPPPLPSPRLSTSKPKVVAAIAPARDAEKTPSKTTPVVARKVLSRAPVPTMKKKITVPPQSHRPPEAA